MSGEFTVQGFFHLRKTGKKKIPESVPSHPRDAVNHINVPPCPFRSPERAGRERG